MELAYIMMLNPSFSSLSDFIAWEYTFPSLTRWGWKIFGLLGKHAQRVAPFLVLGDLNINFSNPWDEWEEHIINLLNNINIIDALRRFIP